MGRAKCVEVATVVDLGGTKAAVAQYELHPDNGPQKCVAAKCVGVADQPLVEILRGVSLKLTHPLEDSRWFGIAAAGVLQGDTYVHERFPVPKDVGEAQRAFGWSPECVVKLNDTEAQTYWLIQPWEQIRRKSRPLVRANGHLKQSGNKVFIAVGTGLGIGFEMVDDSGPVSNVVIGRSEGGHLDLPDRSPFERHEELMRFIEAQNGSGTNRLESLLSGDGIALIDRFLYGSNVDSVSVRSVLADHPASVRVFNLYLGQAIRSLTVTVMATGGVWLWGGVLQRDPYIIEPLDQHLRASNQAAHKALVEGMLFHPSRREVLEQINVFRVLDKQAAVKGILAAVLRRKQQVDRGV